MSKVLLFDDVEENRNAISKAVEDSLQEEGNVELFLGDQELQCADSYERSIEGFLLSNELGRDISLIACDKELGQYEKYRGLSANAVSAVARNLGIPFCQYSRGPSAQEIDRFKALSRWGAEDITLKGQTYEEWGKEIAELSRGFLQIEKYYTENPSATKMKSAQALAAITEHPDAATRISLYGSGDQSVLTEVFAFIQDSGAESVNTRMPRILGTWLILSLLRFPGLLVNKIAAASFLNVSLQDFGKEKVKRVFDSASYSGPFAGLEEWWWRDDLEEMVIDAQSQDGRELLMKRKISVQECLDLKNDRAGYYCMITEQPVSRKNSTGDITWFPAGADLSRIENDKYDEITSLVSV